MESVSLVRETFKKIQSELSGITIQFSKNIASQIGMDPSIISFPKLKDIAKPLNQTSKEGLNQKVISTEKSPFINNTKDYNVLKGRILKVDSSDNQLKSLLHTMLNEEIEVKTSSGDVSGRLISVEEDYIQIGYTILIPLNIIEVVTMITREEENDDGEESI